MILINDFKAEPREMRAEMLAAASRVLDSGWYILGEEVTRFEREWARACGAEHAIGVGNGMDAIEISLRLLDIGPGDEVITTPMTAFATVLAIVRAGATPVLADIEKETALLSFESVERCISPRTKAIVPVHLYGQMRDTAAWQCLCVDKGIELLEDCAQAHLAQLGGKTAGTFGRLGAYSFYPTKNLGAPGDAGAIITSDALLAARAARLRNYGQSVRYHHPELGLNSRLDEIQAAMLVVRLKWLEEFTTRRREIASSYFDEMRNPVVTLMAEPTEPAAHVYHLFVLTCPHRDALQVHLQSHGIQSLIHYPIPVHRQEPFRQIKRDPRGLAASEQHAASCLSIPCHPQLSDRDARAVIDAVNEFEVD